MGFTRPQSLNTQYTNPRQLATLLPTNKHQLPTNQHQLLTMPAPPDTALLQSVTEQHLNQQAMKRHQQVTIQEPAMMLALLLTMLPQLPTSQLHRRREVTTLELVLATLLTPQAWTLVLATLWPHKATMLVSLRDTQSKMTNGPR